MLREDLEPFRGRKAVSYDEGAQIQELRRHYRRLLRGDDHSSGEVTLLSDDRQEGIGQSSRAACLRFRQILPESQFKLSSAKIEAVTL